MTLAQLPRAVAGFTKVEWLVVSDGSTDGTAEAARRGGVDHVIELPHHVGLARCFMAGLEECLRRGAHCIVNTDADNQYCAGDIGKLTAPVLAGEADMVIGARPIDSIGHFSRSKKLLQRVGSWVVRRASGLDIEDAPSGFRAIRREAAMQLYVLTSYTYTLDTIVQAQQKGIRVCSVPVRVNPDLRPSRLVKSTWHYVRRSMLSLLELQLIYHPFEFFSRLSIGPFLLSFFLAARWLYLNQTDFPVTGRLRIPSLIAATVSFLVGAQMFLFGLSAKTTAANRKLLEEIRARQLRQEVAPRSGDR